MKIALLHHQIIRGTAIEIFLIEFAKKLTAAGHELIYVSTLTTPEIGASLPGRWELLPRWKFSTTLRAWHFDRAAPRAALAAGAEVMIGFGRTTRQTMHRNATGCHRLYGRLLWFLRHRERSCASNHRQRGASKYTNFHQNPPATEHSIDLPSDRTKVPWVSRNLT